MFKDLDPLLHSQLRLAVMSLLISVEKAEFTFIKEKTNSTEDISMWKNRLKERNRLPVVQLHQKD
jgi:hypothetical protein